MTSVEFLEDGLPTTAYGDRGKTGIWIERLRPLLERPGVWAKVHQTDESQQASNAAAAIRRGSVILPPGLWDAHARKLNGEHWVVACFLGHPIDNG